MIAQSPQWSDIREAYLMLTIKREEQQDQEWVALIQAAKELGLTPEEVRSFLKEKQE
jgi:DNA-binding transcriptional MerR regulator